MKSGFSPLNSTGTANSLSQDALKFAGVVRDVETALLSVKDLGKHQDCLKIISGILDEAADHLKRLQTANFLSRVAWAKLDSEKFSSLRDQLSLAIQSLSLSVTVDLAALQGAKVIEYGFATRGKGTTAQLFHLFMC